MARSLSAGFGRSAFEGPDVFPLTLAKRRRRTVGWFNPKGMH